MIAQVTLASKGPDGRRKVAADFFLFCVVADALTDMCAASAAPYVVRELETDDQDAFVELACPVAERMFAVVRVQRLFGRGPFKVVWWIVLSQSH